MKRLFYSIALALLAAVLAADFSPAMAQGKTEYTLGAGDSIKISVFQNPDLLVEARVSENGTITYPLVGQVTLGGLTIGAAERVIAESLVKGEFVRRPQVNIVLLNIRGNQISVLGYVNRPGRFPLDTLNTRVSDMLATAGGAIPGNGTNPGGGDVAVLTGIRNGQQIRKEIDIPSLYTQERSQDDMLLAGGDTIYVTRAPVFYIYGEIQRPGAYRIEKGLTVMQAIATGGGPTVRGSERRIRLNRKLADGTTQELDPAMTEAVLPNDVFYVRESLF